MRLTIVSSVRRILEDIEAQEVTFTSSEGQIQILPGHAPMMGCIQTGAVQYKLSNGQGESGVITYGFFDVTPTETEGERVKLVAETFEFSHEIDAERSKRAQQTAENALKEAALEEEHFKKYQLKLERSLIRQQIADKQSLH